MRQSHIRALVVFVASFVTLIPVGVVSAQQRRANNDKSKQAIENLSFEGARSEVYKEIDDARLKAHVFYPASYEDGQKLPAIVFFFGGGWRSGTPAQFEHHCRFLAARGMIAITADYRVASRHGVKANACVADAKSAVRWMRQNAERLGIDADRIVAGGGSAGGHLAACTGVVDGLEPEGEDMKISSRPNAMALFNPALVLAPIGDRSVDEKKLASIKERAGVEPKEISPYHRLASGAPPAIIFHGEADTTVPFETAKVFADKMKENGDRCELKAYPEQGHGFFNYRSSKSKENFRKTVQALDEFLVSLGYLNSDPSDAAKKILR